MLHLLLHAMIANFNGGQIGSFSFFFVGIYITCMTEITLMLLSNRIECLGYPKALHPNKLPIVCWCCEKDKRPSFNLLPKSLYMVSFCCVVCCFVPLTLLVWNLLHRIRIQTYLNDLMASHCWITTTWTT